MASSPSSSSSPAPADAKRKYFSVEEANKALPLVKAIVGDIANQFEIVNGLAQRLAAVSGDRRRRKTDDVYTEELAVSRSELEGEEAKLVAFIEELTALGVELKGPADGLCDFPSIRDGREVYLCWKLGENEIQHWHELHTGFAGRKPLS